MILKLFLSINNLKNYYSVNFRLLYSNNMNDLFLLLYIESLDLYIFLL